jgi:hypothetical protein
MTQVRATVLVLVVLFSFGPSVTMYHIAGALVNSWRANAFGWLVGTGPGAGIGLIFVFLGLIGDAIALSQRC